MIYYISKVKDRKGRGTMNTVKYIDSKRDVEIVFDKDTREIISWSMPYWEDTEIEEEFAYARLAVFG